MNLRIFLVCLGITAGSVVPPNEKEWYAECAKHISTSFFKQARDVAVVNCASCASFLENLKYTINFRTPSAFAHVKLKNYVIFSSEVQDLKSTVENLTRTGLLNAGGNVLVIVEECAEVKDIVQVMLGVNVYKILVLVRDGVYEIDFGSFACVKPAYKKLGDCPDYTPTRYSFKGCRLKIGWAESIPFVIKTNATENPGMMVSLFDAIAHKEDINLKYNEPTTKYIDEVRQTNTYYKLQDDFEANKSDLYLGIASRTFQGDAFDITSSVLQERMVFVAPKPKQRSILAGLQHLLSPNEWAAIIFTFLVSGILIKLSAANVDQYLGDSLNAFSYVFSLLLVNNLGVAPRSGRVRVFLVFLFTYSFIQNMFMQAKLYSLSTKPSYDSPITNIDQVLDSKLPLVFQESLGLIFLFYDPKHTMVFNAYTASNDTVDEDLRNFMERRDFITFVPESVLLTKPEYENYYDKIDIFQYYMVFLMRKNHMLYERIDLRIKQIVQAGLVKKWISDLKWFYYVKNVGKSRARNEPPYGFLLTVNHFAPAFFTLALGYFLATVLFGLEMLAHVFTRNRE